MNSKSKARFVILATGTFAASLAAGALIALTAGLHFGSMPEANAHAAWVSTAETVAEQVMEADLVARVRVLDRGEVRQLWQPTPDGLRVATETTLPFTDSRVEVLDVYLGKAQAGDILTVMQTGGELRDSSGREISFALEEDPLYGLGSELVLFLVDISEDTVHASDGALFRAVNPAGRYDIDGNLVASPADFGNPALRPAELDVLEDEIRVAVAERSSLDRAD